MFRKFVFLATWQFVVATFLLCCISAGRYERIGQYAPISWGSPYQFLYQPNPEEISVDLSNKLAAHILLAQSCFNRNNILFSPWELMNVLAAIYEATDGDSSSQIANALGLAQPADIIFRSGYKDIYRKLKMCCPKIGYPLRSLEFNKKNITITKDYELTLELYGFEMGMMANMFVSSAREGQETPSVESETTEEPSLATTVMMGVTTSTATTEEKISTSTEKASTMSSETPAETTATVAIENQSGTTITTDRPWTEIATTTTTTQEETSTTTTENSSITNLSTTDDDLWTETTTTTTDPTTQPTTTEDPDLEITTIAVEHAKRKRFIPPNHNYFDIFSHWMTSCLARRLSTNDQPIPSDAPPNFIQINSMESFNYFTDFGISVLEFNLAAADTSLIILLPDVSVESTFALRSLLQTYSLREIRERLRVTWVQATLPKIKFRKTISLANHLKNMGIRDIFKASKADFSPMTDEKGVYIKSIRQTNEIDISGDVTSSNRQFNLEMPLPPYAPPIRFNVDRPFFYFVVHKSLSLAIMAGRVGNFSIN